MRSRPRCSTFVAARRGFSGPALLAFALALSGCSKAPSAPSSRPLIGRWTGSINSQAIGQGSATVVFESQIGPDPAQLVTGRWSFAFPDPAFSTTGAISAGFDRNGTILGVFFDRNAVPCPGEPGGSAQKGIAAILTVDQNRMRGDYVVGGCPGGNLDLLKQ